MDILQMIFAGVIAAGLVVTLAAFIKTRKRKERARTEMLRKLGSAILHPKVSAQAVEFAHERAKREMPMKSEKKTAFCPKADAPAEEPAADSRRTKAAKKTPISII